MQKHEALWLDTIDPINALDRLEDSGLCNFFDLGGRVSGSSGSNASQTATLQFIPTVNDNSQSQPLVSSYPAGQGLATLNTAYPASAAFLPSTYSTAATSTGTTSTTTLVVLAAIGIAAWFLLRKKK